MLILGEWPCSSSVCYVRFKYMGSTLGESSICSTRWALASVTYPLNLESGFLSTCILPLKLFCLGITKSLANIQDGFSSTASDLTTAWQEPWNSAWPRWCLWPEIISEQPPAATVACPANMLLIAVEDPQVGRQKGHGVHWHHNISFDSESRSTIWHL